jgi:hypothetical protein
MRKHEPQRGLRTQLNPKVEIQEVGSQNLRSARRFWPFVVQRMPSTSAAAHYSERLARGIDASLGGR